MGMEQLATAVMSELGWINFLLVTVIVIFGAVAIALFIKLHEMEEKIKNLVVRQQCIHENQYIIADELKIEL